MAAPLKLEFRLVGCANNVPIEVLGSGKLDPGRGTPELGLSTAAPGLTFDPALVACGGLDWLLALGACVGKIPTDEPVVVRTMTEILDEDGREVGESKLLFQLRRKGSTVTVLGEIARCAVRMEVGEQVARIAPTRTVLLADRADDCVATTIGAFETGHGHSYQFASMARVGMGLPRTATNMSITAWHIADHEPNAVRLAAHTKLRR